MRGNLATAVFNPGPPPADPAQQQRWLLEMVAQLQAALSLLATGHFDKQFKPPAKPCDGNMAYADGASWNPGSGKGIYQYNGSVWTLIKAIP